MNNTYVQAMSDALENVNILEQILPNTEQILARMNEVSESSMAKYNTAALCRTLIELENMSLVKVYQTRQGSYYAYTSCHQFPGRPESAVKIFVNGVPITDDRLAKLGKPMTSDDLEKFRNFKKQFREHLKCATHQDFDKTQAGGGGRNTRATENLVRACIHVL